jgi:hypothetical protein
MSFRIKEFHSDFLSDSLNLNHFTELNQNGNVNIGKFNFDLTISEPAKLFNRYLFNHKKTTDFLLPMKTPYISHLLLSVIYRELPAEQLEPIFQALNLDEKLRNEFFSLKNAKQAMPALHLEPAQSSLDRIMAIARG